MITTYDDIQTIDRSTLATREDVEREQVCGDGAEEAYNCVQVGKPVDLLVAGRHNEEPVKVLYFADTLRAAVDAGGDWEWTDAISADDAIQRYFGEGGKSMSN